MKFYHQQLVSINIVKNVVYMCCAGSAAAAAGAAGGAVRRAALRRARAPAGVRRQAAALARGPARRRLAAHGRHHLCGLREAQVTTANCCRCKENKKPRTSI